MGTSTTMDYGSPHMIWGPAEAAASCLKELWTNVYSNLCRIREIQLGEPQFEWFGGGPIFGYLHLLP